jgi:D-amino-acid dehydrogenase
LVRGGADIRWETDVTSWRADNGRISAVVTNHGEISGDEFVLCGGVRSVELARMLGLNLPMQAGKGYSLTLENPPQLPGICSILTEARVAITPMAGALRVGGTMEMVGLDESINRKRIHGIVRAIPAYFPEFREQDFDGIEPWVGLRPCSPDGLPYLGRTRKWANLICATGHAMMGISLAPGTGKIVAELVGGPAVSAPLDLLSPDRY